MKLILTLTSLHYNSCKSNENHFTFTEKIEKHIILKSFSKEAIQFDLKLEFGGTGKNKVQIQNANEFQQRSYYNYKWRKNHFR
jgi:hypothetical protein